DGAEYVVVLEDDCVPSPDFLLFHAWALERMGRDGKCLSACGFNRSPKGSSPDPAAAFEHGRRFCSWGYGFLPDRAPIFEEAFKRVKTRPEVSWDCELTLVMREKGMHELRPALSRIKNVGAVDGAYCPGPAHHKARFDGVPFARARDMKTSWRTACAEEAERLSEEAEWRG
ncbi:MAG: hypothetical protein M0R06_17700, partial [Sphaerochaeta sp.]|nr:hypothetical protein [Sphaerochaeta sp.]